MVGENCRRTVLLVSMLSLVCVVFHEPAVAQSNPFVPPKIPTFTSISQSSGTVATTVNAIVTGTNLDVVTSVTFSGTLVRGNIRSKTATSLELGIQIDSTALAGIRTMTLSAPAGSVAVPDVFTVLNPAPRLTGVSPSSVPAGMGTTVVLTGVWFLPVTIIRIGTTPLSWQPGDLTGFNASFPTDRMTVVIPAANIAQPGTVLINVLNPEPGGGTWNVPLTILPNGTPTIASMTPNTGVPGTSFNAVITGTNLNDVTSVAIYGAGVTVSLLTGATSTSVAVNITIAPSAPSGSATVTITNATGMASYYGFTIVPPNPAPVLTSIRPVSARAGSGNTTITLTGAGFLTGSVVQIGSTVLATTFVTSGTLTAVIPAASLVSPGTLNITVVNPSPAGGTSDPAVFTVAPGLLSGPSVTAITPNSGVAGTTVFATITGANLSGVTSVAFNGTGVSAVLSATSTATQIQVIVNIAQNAVPGTLAVTVITPAGSATLNGAFTIQRVSDVPTVPLPIGDVELGSLRSGYAIITSTAVNEPAPSATVTFGMVNGGVVQSQALMFPSGVIAPALPPKGFSQASAGASLIADVIPGIGRNVGIAIANAANATNTIYITLRDTNGEMIGEQPTITLQPQQQVARLLTDLFPPEVIGPSFQGTVTVQSLTPFVLLGLRFSGQAFSTLPATLSGTTPGVVPQRVLTDGTIANIPMAGTIGGPAVMLPHFAMGGGWATQIVLSEQRARFATGRIDIFDTDGNPMAVNMNGVTQSTFTYSLKPNGTFVLAPRDTNGQSPF